VMLEFSINDDDCSDMQNKTRRDRLVERPPCRDGATGLGDPRLRRADDRIAAGTSRADPGRREPSC
jgi:hypothetical protein